MSAWAITTLSLLVWALSLQTNQRSNTNPQQSVSPNNIPAYIVCAGCQHKSSAGIFVSAFALAKASVFFCRAASPHIADASFRGSEGRLSTPHSKCSKVHCHPVRPEPDKIVTATAARQLTTAVPRTPVSQKAFRCNDFRCRHRDLRHRGDRISTSRV